MKKKASQPKILEQLLWPRSAIYFVAFLLVLSSSAPAFSALPIAKDVKVTLNLGKVPLKQAMEAIKSKSGYGFLYNNKLIDDAQLVSVNVKNATIAEVLDALFSSTSITYRIDDEQIILSQKRSSNVDAGSKADDQQQGDNGSKSITIKGQVTDKLGVGIPGASIMVKGTSKGVATDDKGNFSIKVASSDKHLVVTFIGYIPVTYSLQAGITEVSITMEEEAKRLDEVVVTGYQRLSKERATGSFVTVNTKHLESKLQSNLSQVIEGQIAGLTTNDEGKIEIRGKSTLSASASPLIVVDGYPYQESLSTINTNNIENITILKDAVAASIYGARSSNGVIIITTKTGGKDSFSLSYEGTVSFTMKNRYSEFLRGSTSDYIDGQIESFLQRPYFNNSSYSTLVSQYMSEAYFANQKNPDYTGAYEKINKLRGINAYDDIFKYVHRVTRKTTHNIGIRGGTDKASYNLAMKYTGSTGDMINTSGDRLTLDIKNEWRPKKWFSLDVASYIGYSTLKEPTTDWMKFLDGYYTPYVKLFDDSGNPQNIRPFVSEDTKKMIDSRTNMYSYEMNPINDLAYQTKSSDTFTVRLTANAVFKIMDGLTATVGGVYLKVNAITKTVSQKESFYVRNLVNNATDIDNSSKKYLPYGDILDTYKKQEGDWTMRALLNFNRSFSSGKHIVSALAGYEVRKSDSDGGVFPTLLGYNAIAGSFIPIDINSWNSKVNVNRFIDATSIPKFKIGDVDITDNRYVSYFGNGSYEYNNRYIISGSARLDLTNFFGTDPKYRYRPIWSVGGTWKVSNEDFFKVDFINRLHLRGSYGINGNISLSDGPFLIISRGSYSNDALAATSSINSLPNNQLRWEKTRTINGGFDVTFFKDRLNLSVDYYNKLSTDLLASDAIDPTIGFETLKKNVGSISNKGVEVTFNALLINRAIKWNSIVNFSYNKNKVLKYTVSRPYIYNYFYNGPIDAEGYPGTALFGMRFAGLDSKGQSLGYTRDNKKVLLANLRTEDLVYQGTLNPPYSVSFTNQVAYKNFELSVMLIGRFGAKYRKDSFFGNNINSRYFNDRWKKPGDEQRTIYPAFNYTSTEGNTFPYIDQLIGSADYVKVRDVMFNYSLPSSLVKSIGLSKVKAYLQARNIYTFKAKGVDIDPETRGLFNRPEFYAGLTINF